MPASLFKKSKPSISFAEASSFTQLGCGHDVLFLGLVNIVRFSQSFYVTENTRSGELLTR